MSKILFSVALVSVISSAVFAATINIRVETDKKIYRVGQTVSWTIYASASQGDNRGVALISVNLDDNTGEPLSPPLTTDPPSEFLDTNYGNEELFMIIGPGTVAETQPTLRDISVMQFPFNKLLDVGNNGDPNYVLAKGTYTAGIVGEHALNPSLNAANYWPDAVNNAVAFENAVVTPASFTVVLYSDVNKDYYVNLLDLAEMALYFQQGNCNEISGCNDADLDGSGVVDIADLAGIASEWLSCSDPENPECDIYW